MPAFIDTGLNVVDVRDTAEGHLLACERGASGERYILGCENLTLAQILAQAGAHHRAQSALACDFPMRWRIAPEPAAPRGPNLTGTPPRVPLDAVRMAQKKMWVTHEKAARELGFNPGPVDAGAGARRGVVSANGRSRDEAAAS